MLKRFALVVALFAFATPVFAHQAPSSQTGHAVAANATQQPSGKTATPASGFDPAASPTPAVSPGLMAMVLLAGGTNVSVSLSEPISSQSANVGDTVPIVVDQEVDASGFIVIPKGSNGEAIVTLADRAGGNGHGGKLGLEMNWVYSADHGKVLLSNVDHATGEDTDKKGAASTATILSYVLLGPLGLFAHNFVHGKDVTIPTTQIFKIFVDHDVHIQATTKAQAPPGFDN
ncbi:MAG TPA: hypothetical protein VKR56_05145 [Candidatus Cybelea sp.]|nr:hypothetical protein [Candidatus Cybelea sp.]